MKKRQQRKKKTVVSDANPTPTFTQADFVRTEKAWAYLRDLERHPKIQRVFQQSWADTIARDFDPDKHGSLAVVRQGARLLVFDGQHRLDADMKVLGPDQKVPVEIFPEIPIERQAELFLGRNNYLVMRRFDKFKAHVVAKHSLQVDISNILGEHGLRVTTASLPGTVQSVGACETVYTRWGRETFSRTIRILSDAWGDDRDAFGSPLLRGLGELLHRYKDQVNDQEMSKRLAKSGGPGKTLGYARDIAKAESISVQRAMLRRLVNLYNKTRRSGLLLNTESDLS